MFFEQKDVNFAAYADDNTPFFCEQNLEVLLSKLQICALKLFEWFSNNYMKMNSYKCHLILSSNDKNKKIELNGEVINKTQIEKLLGFQIDYKLKFGTLLKLYVKGWEKSFMPMSELWNTRLQTKHNLAVVHSSACAIVERLTKNAAYLSNRGLTNNTCFHISN